MPRYKLTLEYDGSYIKGWQRQDDVETGQGNLEEAVFRFCGERVTVQCAGRTDAGVHALGQVTHIDLAKDWEPFRVMNALNFHLQPKAMAVLKVEQVTEEFHARYSAKGRRYLYRILNRRPQPVLEAGRVWHIPAPLDVRAMQEAAQILIGTHDFTSFRATECQSKSPVKTLDELRVEHAAGDEIHIHANARSFLHHQVRNMVGSLSLVGNGRWSAENLSEALAARDRKAGGPTAAPGGLYFMSVDY